MFLVTPGSGLLIWMTLIFAVLFFVLAKWGFPMITGMVEKRNEHIDESLRLAQEAEIRMRNLAEEQAQLIEQTKKEQGRILREASKAREQMIEEAKAKAQEEADKVMAQAKTELAAQKEAIMRDIRKEVALLSMKVSEKVLRAALESDKAQLEYIDRVVGEVTKRDVS